MMIRRALDLRKALDAYALKLHVSKDTFDRETFEQNYLSDDKWELLALIKDQLEPLFKLTKDLEGNADLKDGVCKASHGALWELLPVFEYILNHFETLEQQAKDSVFNQHPGIQSLITLAWNKTKAYYTKTDASTAWMAPLVYIPVGNGSIFRTNGQAVKLDL
jgi:hypothetical protein